MNNNKVDFCIIGAQKSGTTTLAYQLAQHPEIDFASKKEPHFFSVEKDIKENLSMYHKLFNFGEDQISGEASTSYSFMNEYPQTAQNIYNYNPEMKIIYIVRNPINRIESHYLHVLLSGRKKVLPIDQEIFYDPIYITRTNYQFQISKYEELFDKDNILVLVFEKMVSDPSETLKKLCHFLNISEQGIDRIDIKPQNVSNLHGQLKNFLGRDIILNIFDKFPRQYKVIFKQLIRKVASKVFFSHKSRQFLSDKSKNNVYNELHTDIDKFMEHYNIPKSLWNWDTRR